MDIPSTPPYTNRPSSIPGEPLGHSSTMTMNIDVASPPPPTSTPGWEPPTPAGPLPRPSRQRARFGAGVLVGMAVTVAALGGFVVGQDSSTPVASPTKSTAVPALPVSVSTGSIGDLVEAARPSVVSVRQEVTQTGPLGTSQGQAAGTGFVLSADGYIVTNNHVIADGDSPVVTFADGTSEPATIVAGDPSRDLAVLRVDRADLVPLAVGDSDELRLGDQLIAVDDQSNYPAEALELPNELSGFEPNVEAIAALEPDLVLIGGDFTGLGAQLDELGVAWWDGPAALTLDDSYRQIAELGDATGNSEAADALVKEMQAGVEEIVLAAPEPAEPLSIYHELDPTLYSADSTTFIGELYSLLGLQNIADRAEGDSGGFPQLNPEFIVSADPDVIFLADTKCCAETAETVAARPGWDAIAAVRNGNVFEMDDDVASRWGPRVVEYLRIVSGAVQQAAG